MYNSNGRPLSFAPNGIFPPQRVGNVGNEVNPVAYIDSPVANLPTEEKEYSSVVNRAKFHLAFGEARVGRRRETIGERIAELKKSDIELREPGVSGISRHMRRMSPAQIRAFMKRR